MGTAKATVALARRPLIAYPLESIAAAGLEPIVVAKADSELPPLECRIVTEGGASHPASGIVAALQAAGGPVVVIGCDMPFVPARLVSALAQARARVALVKANGDLQPLLARYGQGAAPGLERAAGRGEPLRAAVEALEPLVLGPDELARFGDPGRIAFNVNDPDDLATAERLMAGGR